MRRIAIVGAGQAGLQLGLGLLARGYQVSITTNRTAEPVSYTHLTLPTILLV